MPRQDASFELPESASVSNESGVQNQDSSTLPERLGTRQFVDRISSAQPIKKRSRNWEQVHRAETVTYRGVPREIHEGIEKLSESLCVPRDEVVRAFLEFSVKQYRCGQLPLIAYPKAQRMTLFPDGEKTVLLSSPYSKDKRNWLDNAFLVAARKEHAAKKGKGQQDIPLWEVRVTYRIPVRLKDEMRSIAEEHTLPVGEVVWFFIDHALNAFRDGRLPLQPVPRSIGKTLFKEGC
jgi:hypothetical protein